MTVIPPPFFSFFFPPPFPFPPLLYATPSLAYLGLISRKAGCTCRFYSGTVQLGESAAVGGVLNVLESGGEKEEERKEAT